MERLVAGRERIYLDRFWNEFLGRSQAISPRGIPGPLRPALRRAGPDACGLRASSPPSTRTPSTTARGWHGARKVDRCRCWPLGARRAFGPMMAVVGPRPAPPMSRNGSSPNAGHWLMEEQPARPRWPPYTTSSMSQPAGRDGKARLGQDGAVASTRPRPCRWRAPGQAPLGLERHPHGPCSTAIPARPGPYVLEIHVPAAYGDRGPHPPRRSGRHGDLGRLVLRLWRQAGRCARSSR